MKLQLHLRESQKMDNTPKSLTAKRKLQKKHPDSPIPPKRLALKTKKLLPTSTCNIANRFSTISNMGNTCYLNSVLYTLRFLPHFSHNLHHLVSDLNRIRQNNGLRLERGNRKTAEIITESLHDVFWALRNQEIRQTIENYSSYQPVALINAISAANDNFARFRQEDAHELLLFLVGICRDAYNILVKEVNRAEVVLDERINGTTPAFVEKDFRGTTVQRTTCCECECSSDNRQDFFDIPVALDREKDWGKYPLAEIFYYRCVKYEILNATNKYFCEECCRYNEASVELQFEKLPNILVFQLKRFEVTSQGNVEKITSYFPTPLQIHCFCQICNQIVADQPGAPPQHKYHLYAVIMHLGTSMASGHYIAYVRLNDDSRIYATCTRQRATDDTNSCESPDCCMPHLKNTYTWIECDDDKVRSLPRQEFQEILGEKDSTTTPYLLVYDRVAKK